MINKIKLLLFFTIIISQANGQKNVERQNLVWYGYHLDFKIKDKWTFSHSLENRQFDFFDRQHQIISVNKLTYDFKNGLKISPGITFFELTVPQDPSSDEINKIGEIRPDIEVSYDSKVTEKIKFQNRGVLEWRYFENSNDNYAFRNYRYRHRIQLYYRISKTFGFRIYDEFMINFGKNIVNNTFDQNRFGLATRVYLKNDLSFEIGYLNWFQQRATGEDFFNRDIVQFTVFKKFDFVKPHK